MQLLSRWVAKELKASYTRTLLPFLNQVSTPMGLLEFMVNDYHPYTLASANFFNPFRSAALVLESLLPPTDVPSALKQLRDAELAFRARWEARQLPHST